MLTAPLCCLHAHRLHRVGITSGLGSAKQRYARAYDDDYSDDDSSTGAERQQHNSRPLSAPRSAPRDMGPAGITSIAAERRTSVTSGSSRSSGAGAGMERTIASCMQRGLDAAYCSSAPPNAPAGASGGLGPRSASSSIGAASRGVGSVSSGRYEVLATALQELTQPRAASRQVPSAASSKQGPQSAPAAEQSRYLSQLQERAGPGATSTHGLGAVSGGGAGQGAAAVSRGSSGGGAGSGGGSVLSPGVRALQRLHSYGSSGGAGLAAQLQVAETTGVTSSSSIGLNRYSSLAAAGGSSSGRASSGCLQSAREVSDLGVGSHGAAAAGVAGSALGSTGTRYSSFAASAAANGSLLHQQAQQPQQQQQYGAIRGASSLIGDIGPLATEGSRLVRQASAPTAVDGAAHYGQLVPQGSLRRVQQQQQQGGLYLSAVRNSSQGSYHSAHSTASFVSATSSLAGTATRLSDYGAGDDIQGSGGNGSGSSSRRVSVGSASGAEARAPFSRTTSGLGSVGGVIRGGGEAPIMRSAGGGGGMAAGVGAMAGASPYSTQQQQQQQQGVRGGASCGAQGGPAGVGSSAAHLGSAAAAAEHVAATEQLHWGTGSNFMIGTRRMTEDEEAGQGGLEGEETAEHRVGKLMSRWDGVCSGSIGGIIQAYMRAACVR